MFEEGGGEDAESKKKYTRKLSNMKKKNIEQHQLVISCEAKVVKKIILQHCGPKKKYRAYYKTASPIKWSVPNEKYFVIVLQHGGCDVTCNPRI